MAGAAPNLSIGLRSTLRDAPLIFVLALSGFAVGGCFRAPKAPRLIDHYDPVIKIPAIKIKAEAQDESVVPQLVEELDNDDPAVRFYAIRALEELTGQTLGYRYYDDDLERRPAVESWRCWLDERRAGDAATNAAATKPSDAPPPPPPPPSARSR
jgi:hypothetical protein